MTEQKETYTLSLNLTCSNGKYRKMFNLGKFTDFLTAKKLQLLITDIFKLVLKNNEK